VEPLTYAVVALGTHRRNQQEPPKMEVQITHHIDASEPGAPVNQTFRYEYDIYRFSDGGETALVARSYKDLPEQASFLRIERNGKHELLKPGDLEHLLFLEAVSYLRGIGKRELLWLNERSAEGYDPVGLPS
jgi:hypothetical protein